MLEYEYEAEMENSYRADFFKSFKKTVEKGYFSFIIVDAVNEKVFQSFCVINNYTHACAHNNIVI